MTPLPPPWVCCYEKEEEKKKLNIFQKTKDTKDLRKIRGRFSYIE
jgi:hypothetical protein